MYGQDFFLMALIYLLAAVVSVPIARKLGLGSVLGYLLAGIIIGPYVLGWIGKDQEKIMHFAEFGVVMMLFLIGLEMQPSLLWSTRRTIFGMGGTQMLLTTMVIGTVAYLIGYQLHQSMAIGLIMSLSSTAIVLQTLDEKGLLKNSGGRSSFAVLLFQDIAVIPILALLPFLASLGGIVAMENSAEVPETRFSALPGIIQLLLIVTVGLAVIFIGRFLARHIFRMVAETGMREVFTASAFLLIIGAALGTTAIGLSPALGTFIAGVVLADNEYRHELEVTVEPFKGLLLGLFFISVGASLNFTLLFQEPAKILGFVVLLISLKFLVLWITGKLWGLKHGREILFSLALAQASEFGFVLISFSDQVRIFDPQTSSMLIIIIILSMASTPLLLALNEKIIRPRYIRNRNKRVPDEIPEGGNSIIIAGFGRFGLVVGRLLMANGFKVTILDSNPANVEILRKYGFKLFYGDVTRPEMLEAAGVKEAKMLILTMAEYDEALKIAAYLKSNYPNLKIAARARDTFHAFEFYKLGLRMVQRETFNSAVELGSKILHFMGFSRYQAFRAARTFKHHEDDIEFDLYKHWLEDENRFIQESRRFSEQLNELLQTEKEFSIHDSDYAWDSAAIDDEDDEEKPK
jgi:monovalent cation:proton antiporter-2 (CPA2) family protein